MRKASKPSSYHIDLIPETRGGFTVVVPTLPGCISYGKTVAEASRNAREAIELHLENLAAHNEPIPGGNEKLPVLSALIAVSPAHAR